MEAASALEFAGKSLKRDRREGAVKAAKESRAFIRLSDVTKRYKLYKSPNHHLMDALGVHKRQKLGGSIQEIEALSAINLEIQHGERVAIVGRNGAGKSTLLKILSGHLEASSGKLEVKGSISALLDMGIGFHDEFTGRHNIKASLAYGNLSASARKKAEEDIVDFVELGAFLDYPVKVYSAGMKMRLYFAVATAVQPKILIIDEVLGAGDAYFGARSKARMDKMIAAGAILILVSHQIGAVLELCTRAIWIEQGKIQMDGPCAEVMDAYKEFTSELERQHLLAKYGPHQTEPADRWIRKWMARREGLPVSRPLNPSELPVAVDALLLDASGDMARRLDPDVPVVLRMECKWGADAVGKKASAQALLFAADGRLVSRFQGEPFRLGPDGSVVCMLDIPNMSLGPGEFLLAGGLVDADAGGKRYLGVMSKSVRAEMRNDDHTETSLVLQKASWSSETSRP